MYSQFDFLLLIGRIAVESKQIAKEGLTALHDYLLIAEYTQRDTSECLFLIGALLASQQSPLAQNYLTKALPGLEGKEDIK